VTEWDGRGTYTLVGAIDAPHRLGVASAFARERRIDPHLEKVTIPGPSEITMLIEPGETARGRGRGLSSSSRTRSDN